MKKIISFSLWGSNPLYNVGAIHNIELAKKIFPDWVCRFYIDFDQTPRDVIDQIITSGAEVVERHGNINCLASLWRFEVMFDESVDMFICRDADARLTLREKLAVDEWVDSDKSFNVMRDHPHHGPDCHGMFGGMWGGKVSTTKQYKDKYYSWVNRNSYVGRGEDQDFLHTHIWTDAKNYMMCLDTYRNSPLLTGEERYFPLELIGNYHVGAIVDPNDSWRGVYEN